MSVQELTTLIEELTQRIVALESKVYKPKPVEKEKKDYIEFDAMIKSAIDDVAHLLLDVDLIRTWELTIVLASIYKDPRFSGFNKLDMTQLENQQNIIKRRMIANKFGKSLTMSFYETGDDRGQEGRGIHNTQSVWVLRDFDKYAALTRSQLHTEYLRQNNAAIANYHQRCKELGWFRKDYPTYPWHFPCDKSPPATDKPTFM